MKHGYIVGNYSLLPGSAVHYECQEGFYSNEGKFSYCTANETWEPATLSCKGEKSLKSFLNSSLRGFMHGKCVCEDSRLFSQSEGNFFFKIWLFAKKRKKIKGLVVVYLFL